MAVDPEVTGGRASFGARYGNTMGPGANKVEYVSQDPTRDPNVIIQQSGKYAYMGSKGGKDVLQDVAGADVSYYLLSDTAKKELNSLMDQLYPNGWDPSWIHKPYQRGLQASAYAYANSGQRLTALDLTKRFLADEAAQGGPGGKGANGTAKYTGPVTTTQTQTSVNLTDPGSARKIVGDALKTYLGRDARPDEQEKFFKALGAQEARNPSVTRATSTTTPMGKARTDVQSTTVSEGGFNPSTFAEEWARGQEGSAEYQAATTYLNTFINALGEAV